VSVLGTITWNPSILSFHGRVDTALAATIGSLFLVSPPSHRHGTSEGYIVK